MVENCQQQLGAGTTDTYFPFGEWNFSETSGSTYNPPASESVSGSYLSQYHVSYTAEEEEEDGDDEDNTDLELDSDDEPEYEDDEGNIEHNDIPVSYHNALVLNEVKSFSGYSKKFVKTLSANCQHNCCDFTNFSSVEIF